MNEQEKIDAILNKIHSEVGDSGRYQNFDSSINMDDAAEMLFDSNLNMDDSILNFKMNPDLSRLMKLKLMNQKAATKEFGLNTYGLNITYIPNVLPGSPVTVTLFSTDTNPGVVVGNTLVFTNGAGDQAIVTGRTASFIQFQNRLRYAPFNIKFGRLNPIDAAQFNQELRYEQNTVWGSGKFNTILPEEHLTPDQFQTLRVDIPMNFSVDSQRGITFEVGNTEVAPGLNWTFWVNALVNESNKLSGKSSAISMNGVGLQQRNPSADANTVLAKFIQAQTKALKMGK